MPGIAEFKLLAQRAPYQLYRYAVDWCKQFEHLQMTVRHWENEEPGSIKGVLDAYAFVVPLIEPKKRLVLEDIMHIHSACMKGVVEGELIRPIDELRRGYDVAFEITPDTCSVLGIQELVRSHEQFPYQIPEISMIQSEPARIECLKQLLMGGSNSFKCYGYDGSLTRDELNEFARLVMQVDHRYQLFIEEAIEPQYLEGVIQFFKVDYGLVESKYKAYKLPVRYVQLKEKYQHNLTKEIQKNVSEVYEVLEAGAAEHEMLAAIVKAIQRLEHLHPFYDGNCRTFCMVILNTLLMQAGFSPALMDDPNKFDGYAIDELITLIHEGMERTRNLCDYVIQEHTTPTFPEAALLPLKLLGGESTMADLLDELDSKPTQHWMDVHPIQRKELNGYANLLAQSLQGKEHSSSPLLQNSLFSTPKLTALDEGDGLFVETHTKNRQV